MEVVSKNSSPANMGSYQTVYINHMTHNYDYNKDVKVKKQKIQLITKNRGSDTTSEFTQCRETISMPPV